MTGKYRGILGAGMLAAITAGLLLAQEKVSKSATDDRQRKAEETAIRELSQAFARAFEKGDAKAVAAFWTEDGEYVDEDGAPVHGRVALEKAYAGFFAKRQELKVEGKTVSIRFLGKDTAVEEGTFTVHAKGRPASASRYSTLVVRQDGRWLMALLKEWGDETTERTSLQDLSWLIGNWESEGGEVRAKTSYEWAEGKKFIRSRYTIANKLGDAAVSSGTQVIGIDPASGLIRAWTFDGDGGIGESTWSWDGERWVVDSRGTLADGSDTTAVNFLTRNGEDGFTWRSVQRTLEGERQPDLAPVKVKRIRDGR